MEQDLTPEFLTPSEEDVCLKDWTDKRKAKHDRELKILLDRCKLTPEEIGVIRGQVRAHCWIHAGAERQLIKAINIILKDVADGESLPELIAELKYPAFGSLFAMEANMLQGHIDYKDRIRRCLLRDHENSDLCKGQH